MPEYSETKKSWHLMVTTRGGKVSMLQNMDAPTARQAYQQLNPDQHPVEYINAPESGQWIGGGARFVNEADIKSVAILGPDGCELDPWRGVAPTVIDLAPERDRQKRASEKQAEINRKIAELKAAHGIADSVDGMICDNSSRCSCCSKKQPNGSLMLWVRDGLRKGDPADQFGAKHWSGDYSAWCVSCFPAKASIAEKVIGLDVDRTKKPEERLSLWQRLVQTVAG
jgi:hypothetical protein